MTISESKQGNVTILKAQATGPHERAGARPSAYPPVENGTRQIVWTLAGMDYGQ